MDTQRLKDKILQLAIQGKLVEQDKNDEPASALVQRIKEERDKLVKEGKIRKPKKLPPIEEDEKPFEIPEGWEWVRLGNLVEFKIGKTPKRSNADYWDNGEYPWFSISDIEDGEIIYDSKEKISEKAYTDIFKGDISPKGTLIMSFKLSIGKMSILGVDGFHNEAIISIFPICDSEEITKMYLFKIMNGLDILGDSKSAIKGATLNTTSLNNILIPLPPFAEQKRIVEKVDELFALIDELDSNKEDLLEVINLTRNQVLQEAIQGKLVEQNPEDEPASVLLDRIKEERDKLIKEKKIRKPKKLPPIEEEEKPFEIPGSWEWVRLGEVANNHDSKRKPVSVKNRDNLEKIYDYYGATGAIDKVDDFIFDGLYLLIGEDGGNFFNDKDVAFIVQGKFWANNHVHVLDCYSEILTKYIKNVLNSINFGDRELITGIAVPKLNQTNLNNILIPLPPLAEQKRIVKKVDTIMDMLDELESQLTN
ncbi:restriction endonuclease subunit S [Anaerosalibacter bizertensis]|uniref:restriction endonuclease subunit S n=1 Tax=Anaerosalibacter bizertensis TaxID=932217 RepID=UPI00351913F9